MSDIVINALMKEMQTLAAQGRHQEALQKGRAVLAMLSAGEPLHRRARVLYNIGTSYTNLGQYAEAEAQYAEAAAGIAHDSDFWYNRAVNQGKWASDAEERGDFTGSQAHYLQALKYVLEAGRLNPNDDDIHQLLLVLRRSM